MKIKNLEDAESMPFRQSMRQSSDYDSWDDYYEWRKWRHRNFTYRFINKNVGQPVDEVYSKFLKSLERFHYSEKCLSERKDEFYNLICRTSRFFNIENGVIIRKERRYKKDRDIYLKESNDATEVFMLKVGTPKDTLIIDAIGYELYNHITSQFIPRELFMYYWSIIDKALRYTIPIQYKRRKHVYEYNSTIEPKIEDYCYIKDIGEYDVLEYRSPRYTRYRAEMKDKSRKESREYKRQRNEYLETLLICIEYKRQAKEQNENDLKIIRHGFDVKTSFRNVSR